MKIKNFVGIGIAIGASIGFAAGITFENLGYGMVFGIGLGATAGIVLNQVKRDEEN